MIFLKIQRSDTEDGKTLQQCSLKTTVAIPEITNDKNENLLFERNEARIKIPH